MSVPSVLANQVHRRAKHRCEYCLMSQSLQGASFHVEHIVPRSLGGETSLENLALACPGCNLHKADRITAKDPETGDKVSLFHPRKEDWKTHFEWGGVRVMGRTASGRATIAMLQMNRPRRLLIRKAETGFGLFPPD